MSSCPTCGNTSGWDCWCSFIASCSECGGDLTAEMIADNTPGGVLCEGCSRTRLRREAQRIAVGLSALGRVNVLLLSEWGRGQGNPPCLVLDEVVPLCRQIPGEMGYRPSELLHAVADVLMEGADTRVAAW